jgi:hypothetical protein
MNEKYLNSSVVAAISVAAMSAFTASSSHFGAVDLILIILQTISVLIFTIAFEQYQKGFRLTSLSGETFTVLITSTVMILVFFLSFSFSLGTLEYLMVFLYSIFSGLLAAINFPTRKTEVTEFEASLSSLLLSQFVMTIIFGMFPHFPGGWVFWL